MSQTELIKSVENVKMRGHVRYIQIPLVVRDICFFTKKPHAHASRKREKPDAFLIKFNFNQFSLPHP